MASAKKHSCDITKALVIMVSLLALHVVAVAADESACPYLEIVRMIPAPGGSRYEVGGLAWDGTSLWAVTDNPDKLFKLSPADGTVLSSCFTPREGCHGLEWTQDELWTGSNGNQLVSVVNPQCSELKNFPLPFLVTANPSGFAWDGAYVWISSESGEICKIDGANGNVVQRVQTGRYLRDLAWDGRYLWASGCGDNALIAFDPTTIQPVCLVPLPDSFPRYPTAGGIWGLAWDGTYFWCSTGGGEHIYKLRMCPTAEIVGTFPAPGGSRYEVGGLAWDGTSLLAVTDNPDKIFKLSPADGTVLSSCFTPREGCHGLEWTQDELWTGSNGNQLVSVVNPQCSELKNFPLPFLVTANPSGFAWDGAHVWISSESGEICKIDGANGNVVQRVQTGRYLRDLAWDGRYLWAAGCGDNALIAFEPTTIQPVCLVPLPDSFPRYSGDPNAAGGVWGLAWDGTHFWCSTAGGEKIYKILVRCVPPDIDIVAWRSVRFHAIGGGLGFDLSIPLDPAVTGNGKAGPAVETRKGGIQKIEVDFDRVIQLTQTSVIEAEDMTVGTSYPATSVNLANENKTLVIEFAGGLPDKACYRIDLAGHVVDLAGDTDCLIRALTGDVNGDGDIDLADMLLLKARIGQPVMPENVRFDVGTCAAIDLGGMLTVKSLIGGTVSCP